MHEWPMYNKEFANIKNNFNFVYYIFLIKNK